MATTRTALRDQNTAKEGDLYVSFELGDKKWELSIGDGGQHGISRNSVAAGDTTAVAACIVKAGVRFKTASGARVHTCYEAGRDGWWLHRFLTELGVDNIVVDASSIEVNRRARRAKTDRLDADKLLTMLMRHHRGERVWSVLREPSADDEDARRVHRELQRLTHERTAHTNRIGSLLVLHNLRPGIAIGGRDWPRWWGQHHDQVGPKLREEIERELARLKMVKDQVGQIEAARREEPRTTLQIRTGEVLTGLAFFFNEAGKRSASGWRRPPRARACSEGEFMLKLRGSARCGRRLP